MEHCFILFEHHADPRWNIGQLLVGSFLVDDLCYENLSLEVDCKLPLLDILPTAEAGGFAPSRARFPVSTRLAHTSFRPSRSYSLSTGIEYRQSGGMYVLSCIDITVMDDPTFGTCPDTHIKRKGIKHMTTIEAALRGGVELVNPDKGSAIPLGFVFQLAHELTPSHITNRFGKTVVLYHVLDLQT